MNKVSIIIPIYNVEKYIEQCIDSLIKQTYTNIEIILIDDGSIDKSSKICKMYSQKDTRIKFISQKNQGVSVARNLGIKISTGKYITFVDSDDWVLETYIETLVKILENNNSQLGIVDYYKVDSNNKTILSKRNREIINYTSQQTLDNIYNLNYYQGYVWNKIFIKEIIINNNIYFDENIKIWEDFLFCCQYIEKIKTTSYIHLPLYIYRIRENSAVTSSNKTINFTKLLALRKMYKIALNLTNKNEFFKETQKYYYNYLVTSYFYIDNRSILRASREEIITNIKENFKILFFKQKIGYLLIKYNPTIANKLQKLIYN